MPPIGSCSNSFRHCRRKLRRRPISGADGTNQHGANAPRPGNALNLCERGWEARKRFAPRKRNWQRKKQELPRRIKILRGCAVSLKRAIVPCRRAVAHNRKRCAKRASNTKRSRNGRIRLYLNIGRHLATQGIAPPAAPHLLIEVRNIALRLIAISHTPRNSRVNPARSTNRSCGSFILRFSRCLRCWPLFCRSVFQSPGQARVVAAGNGSHSFFEHRPVCAQRFAGSDGRRNNLSNGRTSGPVSSVARLKRRSSTWRTTLAASLARWRWMKPERGGISSWWKRAMSSPP